MLLLYFSADKQSFLHHFMDSPMKSRASPERITLAIADMILSDYVSLSIVESKGFLQLIDRATVKK